MFLIGLPANTYGFFCINAGTYKKSKNKRSIQTALAAANFAFRLLSCHPKWRRIAAVLRITEGVAIVGSSFAFNSQKGDSFRTGSACMLRGAIALIPNVGQKTNGALDAIMTTWTLGEKFVLRTNQLARAATKLSHYTHYYGLDVWIKYPVGCLTFYASNWTLNPIACGLQVAELGAATYRMFRA